MSWILDTIRAWHHSSPDAPALCSDQSSVTFSELEQFSNGVSSNLIAAGIGKGSVIGLLVKNGVSFIVCLLGILKSGARCVLLSEQYPDAMVYHILQQTGAVYLMTDRDISLLNIRVFPAVVDFALKDIQQETEPDLRPWIICTSGSTGDPKPNSIPLKLWDDSLQKHVWFYEQINKNGSSGIFAAPCFAFGLTTVLLSLVRGKFAYLANRDERENLFSNFYIIEKYRLKNAVWPTSVVNLLARSDVLMRKIPECLETVGCSGSQLYLSNEFCAFCLRRGISIQNGYGTTETLGIMMNQVDMNRYLSISAPVSVGRPFPGIKVVIRPEEGITEANAGRLELVFEDHVYDEFFPTGRLLTSDLAQETDDGYRLLGRVDRVVKTNGGRVNLDAVECLLMQTGLTVDEVCVLQATDSMTVCFYTAPEEISEKQWHAAMDLILPYYMQPKRFSRLFDFPRLSTGKVDRIELEKRTRKHEQ